MEILVYPDDMVLVDPDPGIVSRIFRFCMRLGMHDKWGLKLVRWSLKDVASPNCAKSS